MSSTAFNMQERKEPAFVKFNEGDVAEGVLLNVERIEIEDSQSKAKKNALRYTVQDLETGDLSSFLGAYQIDVKLRPVDKGHYISVRYEGEDKTVSRNGNAMKRFKVLVSNASVSEVAKANGIPLADGTFITNDDIPW